MVKTMKTENMKCGTTDNAQKFIYKNESVDGKARIQETIENFIGV